MQLRVPSSSAPPASAGLRVKGCPFSRPRSRSSERHPGSQPKKKKRNEAREPSQAEALAEVDRVVGIVSLHDLARAASREQRRFLPNVRMKDVAMTFAEISEPTPKPAVPEKAPRENIAYAE